jgi:uncharacterized membrane protein
MSSYGSARLGYIDWLRGWACLVMFQGHAYDSWLGGAARQGKLLKSVYFLGSFPAAIFLFLAGISAALVYNRSREKGQSPTAIAGAASARGAKILLLALLFRFQQWLFAYPWAPWTDLLRVDILNAIGVSLILAAAILLFPGGDRGQMIAAALLCLVFVLAAPPLWTTHRPTSLPWWAASYLNGGHTDYQPHSWAFPLFPWAAYAFAGCISGSWLARALRERRERIALLQFSAAGVALMAGGYLTYRLPVHLYAVEDFWHTSPSFFLIRLGFLHLLLALCYAWYATGIRFLTGPIQTLGTTSLLVYWVHIELVYGRFSLLPKRASSQASATVGLAVLTAAMMLLSHWRRRQRARG